MIYTEQDIAKMLMTEAYHTLGVTEVGGNNMGKEVEEYQRTTDNKAEGEAWCMAWLRTMAERVCKKLGIKNPVYPSEHCQTVFNNTPAKYISKTPAAGFAFIRRNWGKQTGHTGMCQGGLTSYKTYPTIEGNTHHTGVDEPDRVMRKYRFLVTPTQETRGFINLPKMILDEYNASKTS